MLQICVLIWNLIWLDVLIWNRIFRFTFLAKNLTFFLTFLAKTMHRTRSKTMKKNPYFPEYSVNMSCRMSSNNSQCRFEFSQTRQVDINR